VNATAVRQQLDRIVHSRTFRHFDRLKRLLFLLVHESLVGRADNLTEAAIAARLFENPSFDPQHDPIVRVQMRRLQRRLADYYDHEGVADDVLIALPDTGFLPVLTGRPGRRTHIRPAGRHSHGRR
jgi:hypothetical protein